MVNVFVSIIPANRNPVSSGFRVAFHLPGMTILLPQMSNFASPPAEPGVYLGDNYILPYDNWKPERIITYMEASKESYSPLWRLYIGRFRYPFVRDWTDLML